MKENRWKQGEHGGKWRNDRKKVGKKTKANRWKQGEKWRAIAFETRGVYCVEWHGLSENSLPQHLYRSKIVFITNMAYTAIEKDTYTSNTYSKRLCISYQFPHSNPDFKPTFAKTQHIWSIWGVPKMGLYPSHHPSHATIRLSIETWGDDWGSPMT